ncbi:MAG: hypothetical protein OXE44_00365 [Nitrospinae bacterium]|nr:hypothetical protein [Nitrospinota bacterium]
MQARLFTRTIIFALAVVAYAALPATQASAQDVNPRVQECRDAMDDSTARTHCPELKANAVAEFISASNMCWYSGSCSVTVKVDGVETSYDISVSLLASWDNPVYISPADLKLLDVCFVKTEGVGQGKTEWGMQLKAGCASDDTDADTAKANGLSTETGSN